MQKIDRFVRNLYLIFKKIGYVILFHIAFFVAQNSFAQDLKQDFLRDYSADLQKIENYLNNIKNLSARFAQVTTSGNIAHGNFYLSRPGKMRIQYDGETPIVIVVNGAILSYYDVELDEISNLRTNTTPASFLTRDKISFDADDVDIISVEKRDDIIKVTLLKKNSKKTNQFALVFGLNPVTFIQMEVMNDLEELIKVSLYEVDLESEIPAQTFVLKTENFND